MAKAVLDYVKEQNLSDAIEISEFQAVPGNGLSGMFKGQKFTGGNLKFIRQYAEVSKRLEEEAKNLADQGKTPFFLQKMKNSLE